MAEELEIFRNGEKGRESHRWLLDVFAVVDNYFVQEGIEKCSQIVRMT